MKTYSLMGSALLLTCFVLPAYAQDAAPAVAGAKAEERAEAKSDKEQMKSSLMGQKDAWHQEKDKTYQEIQAERGQAKELHQQLNAALQAGDKEKARQLRSQLKAMQDENKLKIQQEKQALKAKHEALMNARKTEREAFIQKHPVAGAHMQHQK